MKNNLKNKIIIINLFISIFLYIPICLPVSVYLEAYEILLCIMLVHILALATILYSISAFQKDDHKIIYLAQYKK